MLQLVRRLLPATMLAIALAFALTGTALAHEAPDEGEAAFVLADWMLYMFLMFAGAAAIVFVFALKRGMFRNLEDSKYYLLEYPEPDYFSPDWARRESDETSRERNGNGARDGDGRQRGR